MERRTIEYLDPQEQLRVAALVNRICEVSPEEFDASTQIEDAREIIKALDSKIEPTKSKFVASASYTSTSESSVMSGATDQGNVSTSFEETKEREVRIGKILAYRIGMYVVTKRSRRSKSALYFEHFWDRGEINEVFEREQPTTKITYNNSDLELLAVSKLFPRIRHFGFLAVTTYQRVDMWKAERN